MVELPKLPSGNADLTRKTVAESVAGSAQHLTFERLSRALLGCRVGPLSRGDPDLVDLEDTLLPQVESLYRDEQERAAETRRRSDQLLTRLIAVSPFAVGAVTLALSRKMTVVVAVGLALALLATVSIVIAFLAIRNNLGKQAHYAPLSITDLDQGGRIKALGPKLLVLEYRKAVLHNDVRNGDAIDRLHTAFALFIIGVLFALLAAGFLLFAIISH